MANFNGYDDVRAWLTNHTVGELRESTEKGDFRGKTLSVARAYLQDLDEGAFTSNPQAAEEGHGLVWRRWQIAAAAGVLIVPALLVWVINMFRG
jgi:hypothetical protein